MGGNLFLEVIPIVKNSFKIFFTKHNLLSFKFSTKVWEKGMLVNTLTFIHLKFLLFRIRFAVTTPRLFQPEMINAHADILRDKINVYSRHKQSFGRFYALSGRFFMV